MLGDDPEKGEDENENTPRCQVDVSFRQRQRLCVIVRVIQGLGSSSYLGRVNWR